MEPIKLTGFELIEQIGQGGMGVVWKARQLSLDRIVAIKLLTPDLARNPADVKSLLAEARAAAKLKHPGIVEVYDSGEENGVYYFVMEYVAGYSVGEWLRRKSVIPEKDALTVAIYVAQALNYAWTTSGLIHCDIKPDNIMVDKDGTIKVADLGLSRTIGTRREEDEEILGTPAYMAPEQVMGEPDLDCRTDIYALGATLYHLVTGHRLFERIPDKDAAEHQINDTEPDPVTVNNNLSPECAWLIESLLVKERRQRPKEWKQVIADLQQVEKGMMPVTAPPAVGTSTVRRSRLRLKLTRARRRGREVSTGLGVMLVLAVIAAVIGGTTYMQRRSLNRLPPPLPPRPPPPRVVTNVVVVAPPKPAEVPGAQLKDPYEKTARWARENPDRPDESIQMFMKLAAQATNSPYEALIGAEIKRLEQSRAAAVDHVWQGLSSTSQVLVAKGQLATAVTLLEGYTGAWWKETETNRHALARRLRAQTAELESAKRAEQQWKDLLGVLVQEITAGRFGAAYQAAATAAGNSDLAGRAAELQAVQGLLDESMRMNDRILDSFRKQVGARVTVDLARGPMNVNVVGVEGGKVRLQAAEGPGEVAVGVEDLSTKERLQRLGADDSPVAALARGSIAAGAQAYTQAAEYFAKLGPPLADPLVAQMKEGELKSADESAERVLQRLLKNAQVEVGAFDEAAWTAAVAKFKPDAKAAESTLAGLEKFRQKYGESRFAKRAEGVMRALEFVCQAALPTPAVVPEAKPGPAPAPDETRRPRTGPLSDREVQRLLMRFAESNHGLDPDNVQWELDPRGALQMLRISCGKLQDLEALRELGSVAQLSLLCWDNERSGVTLAPLRELGIVDLHLANLDIRDPESLRAMKLERLTLESCALRDLGCLAGSAVKDLSLERTEVKDLAPLKGLPLESLNLDDSRVQDLWALSGMPLKSLSLRNTLVREIGVLKGMPLERLVLGGTRVFQFQGLKGMALRALDLSDTQFRDLSLCEGMPLDELRLRNTQVASLAPLAPLQLKALDISGTPINDLSPLRNMPLRTLGISNTRLTVEDMTVLKAMPLEHLEMAGLPIEDLSFLREKPLIYLDIENTAVRDLWPLAGMRLREFRCRGSKVKGLTVLRDMPITELTMNGDPREAAPVLRTLTELRRVNGEFLSH